MDGWIDGWVGGWIDGQTVFVRHNIPTTTTTQPPTVACKMEAKLEYMHIIAYAFLHVWHRPVCSVGTY